MPLTQLAWTLVGGWLTVIGVGMIVLTVADWILVRQLKRRGGKES